MTYSKGQQITVKDYLGKAHVRYVWKDCGSTVLITTEDNLRLLEAGRSEVPAIGVPKKDVLPMRARNQSGH